MGFEGRTDKLALLFEPQFTNAKIMLSNFSQEKIKASWKVFNSDTCKL